MRKVPGIGNAAKKGRNHLSSNAYEMTDAVSKELRNLDRKINNLERVLEFASPFIDNADFQTPQPVNETLTPLGSSGWFWNGTTPLNPNNCAEWPNSPFCGGQFPVNPTGLKTLLDANVSITLGPCEQCATFNTFFLGVPGPPLVVCHRNENCREPEPEIKPQVEQPKIKSQYLSAPVAPPNHYRVMAVYSEYNEVNRVTWENFGLFGNPPAHDSNDWDGFVAGAPGSLQIKLPGELHALTTVVDTTNYGPDRFIYVDHGQGWQEEFNPVQS